MCRNVLAMEDLFVWDRCAKRRVAIPCVKLKALIAASARGRLGALVRPRVVVANDIILEPCKSMQKSSDQVAMGNWKNFKLAMRFRASKPLIVNSEIGPFGALAVDLAEAVKRGVPETSCNTQKEVANLARMQVSAR